MDTSCCGNCGRPSGDLAAVHRLYFAPERVRVEDVEWWCSSCCSQYPYDEVEEGKGATAGEPLL